MREQGTGKYRYEIKYVCSDLQMLQMEEKISVILARDPHVGGNGFYTIRSLYFDDYYNSAFYEKEDGNNPREKYRLRYYNNDKSRIHLEIKKKAGAKIQKESSPVTEKEAEAMAEGQWTEIAGSSSRVVQKFFLNGMTRIFRPKIIVEYDRVPYICREGNVRITFDKNIRSSSQLEDFWKEDLATRPVMPSGQHLLEVKFDEFLPDYIYNTLQMEHMVQTAFSKYYLCRKYTI